MAKTSGITHRDIIAEVGKGEFRPVYLLMGEESYYIDKLSDYISSKAVSEDEAAFNLITIYATKDMDSGAIVNAAKRYPMMSKYQVVIVKECQNVKNFDALNAYLAKPMTTTVLILCYKNGTMDRRKKTVSLVEASGVVFNSPRLKDGMLPSFISDYLRRKKVEIENQAMMMLVAVVAIPLIIMSGSGGFASTMDAVNAQNPYLMSLFTNATTGKSIGLIALISSLAWGLGYFGMPHILVRFMSIKEAEEIKHSRRIAMTWVTICLGAVIMIALLGRYYVEAHGIKVDDPERIFMILCQVLCHPAIAAILMAAILAAIMSTADSQLLVSASAFSNDLYKHLFRKNASNKEVMWVSRGVVVAITIIAVIVAMQGAPSADGVKHGKSFLDVVMSLVSFAWGGFGATFGPIMLLALFWKRTTLPAAIAGMLVGGITTFVWKFYLSSFPAEIFQIYELVPGFVLSFVTIVVVSLLTKAPSKEIQDEFDQVEHTRLSTLKL